MLKQKRAYQISYGGVQIDSPDLIFYGTLEFALFEFLSQAECYVSSGSNEFSIEHLIPLSKSFKNCFGFPLGDGSLKHAAIAVAIGSFDPYSPLATR